MSDSIRTSINARDIRLTLLGRHLSQLARPAACAFILAVASVSAQAPLDIRVALVIGNSSYPGASLINPSNDAKAVGEALRNLGFSVTVLLDGKQSQMLDAISKVRESLKSKQGVGMLYYAGHGLQLDWHNYMVPVDAKLTKAADVPLQTVDINAVMDAFKSSGARMNILVLDACRDNPFSSNASGKGLAQQDAPPGTILAYATAPGNVAEDGDLASGNGLYTQYLLEELRKPASIENVFKRVRLNVRKQSQGRQIPWESTSLEEDFYFNDGVKFTYSPAELQRLADLAKAKEQQRLAEEAAAKEREKAIATQIEQERERQIAAAKALEEQRLAAMAKAKDAERLAGEARAREVQRLETEARLLEQRRLAQLREAQDREQALKAAQAKEREAELAAAKVREQERAAEVARLAELNKAESGATPLPVEKRPKTEGEKERAFTTELQDWNKVKESKNPDDLYAFLQRYPSGYIAEQAQFKLDQIAKTEVVATPGINGVNTLPNTVARYKVGDKLVYATKDFYGKSYPNRTWLVTEVKDGKVQINNGSIVLDEMGNLIKNSLGTRNPAKIMFPADLAIGKKWRTAYSNIEPNGVVGTLYWDFHVVALDSVNVPAGSFKAFRIEGTSVASNGNMQKQSYWIDSATMMMVKDIYSARNRGVIVLSNDQELISYARGN